MHSVVGPENAAAFLLQNGAKNYYKTQQLLQNASIITKCGITAYRVSVRKSASF